MNKEKNQKGSITLFVLISILFFSIVLTLAYISATNKVGSQKEQVNIVQENYAKNIGNEKNIYENIINGSDTHPSKDSVADEEITFPTAYGKIDVIWLKGTTNTVATKANAPVLGLNGESMTPVSWTYSYTSHIWNEDKVLQNTWYNYEVADETDDNLSNLWANAKTKNGSYFVWIPRYAYRITYYSSETSTEPTGYYDGYGMWRASDGKLKYALDEGIEIVEYNGEKYIVHPAFETNLDNGGWDEELEGFWVAKYEMSGTGTDLKSTNTTTSDVSLDIGTQYKSARTATYGYNGTTDDTDGNVSYMHSHMMKNSEWGAVAYLTHSQYGRNGKEIDINNSTTHTTGNGGGAVGGAVDTVSGNKNPYFTSVGAKASTTGNVYGVYDMSGGAWERVATFNSTDSEQYFTSQGWTSATGLTVKSNSTKYATKYNNTTTLYYGNTATYKYGKVGDATKEVNTGGVYSPSSTTLRKNWFSDYLHITCANYPFFNRGGHYGDGVNAGLFYSSYSSGEETNRGTYRTVLCP